MNLYLLLLNFTNGFHSVSLNLVTVAAILCGVLVIVSKNPIVSVLYLIGLFLSISLYLMLLGINFIGLSYLLVYVGAVSILFLFILMLINIRISEIFSSTSNSIPLAIIIGTLFFSTVYQALPLTSLLATGTDTCLYSNNDYKTKTLEFHIINDENNKYLYNLYDISYDMAINPGTNFTSRFYEYIDKSLEIVSSQVWDTKLAEFSHINTLGNILYTSFPLWILLTSLILLLAMVGAIVITLKE